MEYDLVENDGVFTLKNQNTTIGFVRFNELGEVDTYLLTHYLEEKILPQNYLN